MQLQLCQRGNRLALRSIGVYMFITTLFIIEVQVTRIHVDEYHRPRLNFQ